MNESPHSHWRSSGRRRKRSGEFSRPSHFRILSGAVGLAQGSACDTEIWPPLANEVSMPASACRSRTVTSCPALLRYHAEVTPTTPAPSTRTFMSALLHCAPLPLSVYLRDSTGGTCRAVLLLRWVNVNSPLSRIRLIVRSSLGGLSGYGRISPSAPLLSCSSDSPGTHANDF